MAKWKKTLEKVLGGQSDANIRFDDLCQMLDRLGYQHRVEGSHRIYIKPGIGFVNLQPEGGHAKPYQVRQTREVLQKDDLP